MNPATIQKRKEEIIERYGPWTACDVQLTDNVYTMDERLDASLRLGPIMQICSDIACAPLKRLRFLDLGCLEGQYAIELARIGAEVIAIEGREANIVKGEFVKEVLSLDGLTFVRDDVRNLSVEKYGHFDVVLCLGILYHLDAPDVFPFLENVSAVCRGFTLIDTHISVSPDQSFTFNEHEYRGWFYTEHQPDATLEEKVKVSMASLDNVKSFWLARPSLYNALARAGFTSVHESHNPPVLVRDSDRVLFVGIKGERNPTLFPSLPDGLPETYWPELPPHPSQQQRKMGPQRRSIRGVLRALVARRSRADN